MAKKATGADPKELRRHLLDTGFGVIRGVLSPAGLWAFRTGHVDFG